MSWRRPIFASFDSAVALSKSDGAGATGWLQFVHAGTYAVILAPDGRVIEPVDSGRMTWDTSELFCTVRQPFPGSVTGTPLTFGVTGARRPPAITSRLAGSGVIFSDGIDAGANATIGVAKQKVSVLCSKNHSIAEVDNEYLT